MCFPAWAVRCPSWCLMPMTWRRPPIFSIAARRSPCSSAPAPWGRKMKSNRRAQLGAGVAKSRLGKAVMPEDVPFCTGHIGLLGSKPSWDLMQECDTLLVVGSSFPYGEFYPKAGQAKAVQIDLDGRMLSLRYPMDVNLKGDAKQTLNALLPLLVAKNDHSWQEKVIENVREVVESRLKPAP